MLTLWAAVVAERLGHPADAALTLGRAVAGASPRAKARRLGIADEHQGEDRAGGERHAEAAPARAVRPLWREVAENAAALDKGRPASAAGVRPHLTRALGDHLGEDRAAMEDVVVPVRLKIPTGTVVAEALWEGFSGYQASGAHH